MKISFFYFDEKDILFVILLFGLIIIKYLNILTIFLFSVEKLIIILLISFIGRIFLGGTKSNLIFYIVIISIFISNSLSLQGLTIFVLLSLFVANFIFRN
ncbi:MAG: hypothetical protein KatS3mg092_0657 [Patescibacteria group bacterium]|nr:MAG: hypothetical protein KatS3mg092_0657 [Patescibacteria group bacterium]